MVSALYGKAREKTADGDLELRYRRENEAVHYVQKEVKFIRIPPPLFVVKLLAMPVKSLCQEKWIPHLAAQR